MYTHSLSFSLSLSLSLSACSFHAFKLLRSGQKSWRCGERVSGLCVVGVLTFCCSTLCKSEGGGDANHGDRWRHFVRVDFFGWLHASRGRGELSSKGLYERQVRSTKAMTSKSRQNLSPSLSLFPRSRPLSSTSTPYCQRAHIYLYTHTNARLLVPAELSIFLSMNSTLYEG